MNQKFKGIWYLINIINILDLYQIKSFKNIFSFYLPLENGTISILNAVGIGDRYQPQCGHAYPKFPSTNKGIWSVYFPDEISNYYMLSNGTDYDYYSAVYYCKDSEVGPIEEDGLILTRYKHPSFSQVTILI